MVCSNCGQELEADQLSCPACGALTVRDDPVWLAATADDPPTVVMPAVPARAAADSPEPDPTSEQVAATSDVAAAPVAGPAAIDRSPPPAAASRSVAVPSPGRHMSFASRRPFVVGAAAGAIVVAVVAIVLIGASGALSGLFAAPDATAGAPPGELEESTPLPMGEGSVASGEFSCSPREVTAPSNGRWRLYRAEFGPRGNFDYLRLKLRREGDHEQAPAVIAELVAPADVAPRFGVEAQPGGDIALVVAFNGPVGIGGSWGANPGYGALREFRIARGQEGRVYAVAGVSGQGCFTLSDSGWDAGETAITLEIQKR